MLAEGLFPAKSSKLHQLPEKECRQHHHTARPDCSTCKEQPRRGEGLSQIGSGKGDFQRRREDDEFECFGAVGFSAEESGGLIQDDGEKNTSRQRGKQGKAAPVLHLDFAHPPSCQQEKAAGKQCPDQEREPDQGNNLFSEAGCGMQTGIHATPPYDL